MIEKESFFAKIHKNSQKFANLSDMIWDVPETAYRETRSAALLQKALADEGFTVETGLAGIPTAFTARFGAGKPVIGILAEFDALSALSQRSGATAPAPIIPGGNGHGCGHHLLGVGSAAAAIAVKEWLFKTGTPGTIILFGCPAEEGGSGKAFMARGGVFDGLDAALTWHPGDINAVMSTGTLCNIEARYRFTGISAHASAAPHMGRSALDAVELMNVGANFLREHIVPDARVHYAITDAGGVSPNVIPAGAEVTYLVRAAEPKDVQEIYQRVNRIAQGAALMTDTQFTVQFIKACSGFRQSHALQSLLWDSMEQVGIPAYTDEEQAQALAMQKTYTKDGADPAAQSLRILSAMLGTAEAMKLKPQLSAPIAQFILPYRPSDALMPASTDVGDVSQICPTAQFGTVTFAAGTPGHSWQLVAQGKSSLAHKGMLQAAQVLALSAAWLFDDSALLQSVQDEFSMHHAPYVCPIPADVQPPLPKD